MSGTHKYPTISFRISSREREEIEARILASGLSKKDYFVRFCIYDYFWKRMLILLPFIHGLLIMKEKKVLAVLNRKLLSPKCCEGIKRGRHINDD